MQNIKKRLCLQTLIQQRLTVVKNMLKVSIILQGEYEKVLRYSLYPVFLKINAKTIKFLKDKSLLIYVTSFIGKT